MKVVAENVSLMARSLIVTAAILTGLPSSGAFAAADIETVLKDYLSATYSRDASAAYERLSKADQDVKSLEEYAGEIGAFDGSALVVAKALAEHIEFGTFDIQEIDNVVDVTFDVTLPNANHPAIRELMRNFDNRQLSELTPAEIETLTAYIRAMHLSGELPVLESEGERWSLVREGDQWRVFENWAEAVEVRFDAATFHDLPWEFEPVRTRVMAKHGETIQMAYRARNVGDEEITAKARHIIGPDDDADFLDIISCFCFLEETLAPGEEAELSLVFRVDYEAPDDAAAFTVKYEFYPAERFPEDEHAHARVQR